MPDRPSAEALRQREEAKRREAKVKARDKIDYAALVRSITDRRMGK